MAPPSTFDPPPAEPLPATPAAPRRRWRRAALLGLAAALVLALAALAAQRLAVGLLHDRLVAALGPRATLQSIELGWRGVELRGLRIAAAPGWPAADELRAERVVVVPRPSSLLGGGPWQLQRIDVEGAYLSLQRGRDGRLRLLPALLERTARDSADAAALSLWIGELRLAGAAVELFDGSLRGARPHRVRLDTLDASVGPLALPALDQPIDVAIAARLRGPRHDGRLTLDGVLRPATRDATLAVRAHGVDLVALQPYLLRAHDGGVRRGRLDLQLDATVRGGRLQAPGRLTLTDLELAGGDGVLGTLAGVSRQAVLAALRRDGRIELRFTLDGRLDDPAFSLDERLATRVAGGLADAVGVSVGGVVDGVGSVVRGLLGR